MSNRTGLIFCAGSLFGSLLVVVLYWTGTVKHQDAKPSCTCTPVACPVCETCPPPVACPPQPVLEIHKPLSQELDAVVAQCKPVLDRALAAQAAITDEVHAALKAARDLGVSSQSYDWLENPVARAAATNLLRLREPMHTAMNEAARVKMRCEGDLYGLLHATDAWNAIDSEEIDEALADAPAEEFYEFFNYDSLYLFECNMVARRLECPPSAETSVGENGETP